jgi:hypothetical protein
LGFAAEADAAEAYYFGGHAVFVGRGGDGSAANLVVDDVEIAAAAAAPSAGVAIYTSVVVDADGWRVETSPPLDWTAGNAGGTGLTSGLWSGGAGDLLVTPHLVVTVFGGAIDIVDVRFLIEDQP